MKTFAVHLKISGRRINDCVDKFKSDRQIQVKFKSSLIDFNI